MFEASLKDRGDLEAETFIRDFYKYRDRVIFAHDLNISSDQEDINRFVHFETIKISHRSIFGALGPSVVSLIRELDANQVQKGERIHNRKIMIDLKLHDIPSSTAEMAKAIVTYFGGVDFLTIHASGGSEMMKRCVNDLGEWCEKEGIIQTKVIAVTALTSMTSEVLQDDLRITWNGRESYVFHLASLAKKAGCHGIVCSFYDVRGIVSKGHGKLLEDFIVMCPGIRFTNDSDDDQKNIVTPQEALSHPLVDYIVMGRSLLSRLNEFKK